MQATASTPERDTDSLKRRITYLMLFRLVLISLVLGSTFLIGYLSDVDLQTQSAYIQLGIIAFTYLLTIVYALIINRVTRLLQFAYSQLAMDLVIATLLVHVTGGAQSAYSFFYPVTIIGAATVRYRRGAVISALLAVGLYVGVAMLGWTEILPTPSGQRILPYDLVALELARSLGLNIAAFGAVGFLAVNLGGQLQRTSASLASERTAAADLYARHEDIVRCLSSGLITVDQEDRVLTMNEAARELLAISGSFRAGDDLADLAPELAKALDPLASRQSIRRGEVYLTGPAGRDMVVGVSISPLTDHLDQVHGRIINFQDLSELKAMETQVRQAERLATIGTVAAGVAHELRNPLASISGSIELLRNDPKDPADREALMGIVTREVGRLDTLIAELLDYTNPRPRELVRFDLTELASETLKVFSQDSQFQGVTVRISKSSDTRPLEVVADPAKLRQVLWNLLRNAAEAARTGGGHVVVELARSQDQALIDVVDDGPGIPDDAVGRVFDPFFTTRSGGTGLGLAIVRNIVTEHGGGIDVDTELGKGTTFSVRIPIGGLAAHDPAEGTEGIVGA